MSAVGKSTVSPAFVQARNKKDLVKKMLNLNLRSGMQHNFFAIQKDGSFWVAWYYRDHERVLHEDLTKKVENGD